MQALLDRTLRPLASSGIARRAFWIAAALAFACFLPFWVNDTPEFPWVWSPWGSPIRNFQYSLVLLFATALLGMTVLTGRAGLVSIGHGAFVAFGAYAAAISMHEWDLHYALAIPFAGLVGFALGGFFGLPALRLSAHALTVVSISVALALAPVIKDSHFDQWTGGSTGLVVQPIDVPFGLSLTDDQWLYFVALMVFLFCLIVVWSLVGGRLGRAWVASRDHEIAAASMGVNLALYRTMAFAFAGLFAGLAGGLYTIIIQFVSPESFTVNLSILLLTGLVVGGRDTIIGVLPGAFFIQFVPIWTSDFTTELDLERDISPSIVYGAVLIMVMFLMPGGFMGTFRQGWILAKRTPGFLRGERIYGPRVEPEKPIAGGSDDDE